MAAKLTVKIFRAAGIGLSVALAVAIAGIAESYYERSRAEELIALLSEMRVGQTTEASAKEVTQKFSRYKVPHNHGGSVGEVSYDRYEFQNLALALLHVSPFTTVWVDIRYNENVVVAKSVQYYEEPRCSGVMTETLRKSLGSGESDGAAGGDRDVYLSSPRPSPVFIMKVTDDNKVPSARRRLDWRIGLSCMTTIGGCRDPRKVFYGVSLEPSPH